MSSEEILKQAMALNERERFLLIEGLLNSLNTPDNNIDETWLQEAENRLTAYRGGRLEGIPMEDVFRNYR